MSAGGNRRGVDVTQKGLFVMKQTSDYIPAGHPLIAVREILNQARREMDGLFTTIHEDRGRYAVPPEWLLRGLVRQTLYGIRSERRLCEQRGYNMLYRWLVGLRMEDTAWDHSTYTQNRDSFVPKDGPPPSRGGRHSNPEVDFKHQKRRNDTHESQTDAEARRYTQSNKTAAIPAYPSHVLMENRNKLAVDTRLTIASGTAEREAALDMLEALPGEASKTVGADKNHDAQGFVTACRGIKVTPHVARNVYEYDTKTGKRARRQSNIDARTTRHPGYGVSQVIRKMIETLFGAKPHGATIRQTKRRGQDQVADVFTRAMLTVNWRRLSKLLAMPATLAGTG